MKTKQNKDCCPSCGVAYEDHLGFNGTCHGYRELLSLLRDIAATEQPKSRRLKAERELARVLRLASGAVAYGQAGTTQGWTTAVEGVGTDVSITPNKYVAVPITVGNNIIAATNRRLFEEQAPLAEERRKACAARRERELKWGPL